MKTVVLKFCADGLGYEHGGKAPTPLFGDADKWGPLSLHKK